MARELNKLNALAISRAKARGYLSDGGGLYLQISPNGTKSWVFRFRDGKRLREMGLGPTHTVSLAEARDAALLCRKQRHAGLDPIAARHNAHVSAQLEAAKALTFEQCAEAYIESHRPAWRNAKHAAQWGSTLKTYAYPMFGHFAVASVDTRLVLKALEPIWSVKPETASRLRQRIEAVLDWARVRGHRDRENPARWKGHLDQTLPARGKVAKVEHHAALPYDQIGPFFARLREQAGVSALALQFAILTAARTGEILGATWDEIDPATKLWTIPAERMKAGREHRIPLSEPALAVLAKQQASRTGYFVFPGGRAGRPLSGMSLLMTLRRMGRGELTTHGFRSTFRDWAAERTNYPREVAEHALAHSLPDKVEAAYRRGDLLEKRRQLMAAWAAYCGTLWSTGELVALNAR